MNELSKAIDTAEIILKSHIKAYVRQDGTAVKEHDDNRHKKMVEELHAVYEQGDKKGRGGLGISVSHPDYANPEKYLKTIGNIRKFKAHATWTKTAQAELDVVLNRHEQEIKNGTKNSLPPTIDQFLKKAPNDIKHIVVKVKKDRTDDSLKTYIYGERSRGEDYYFCDKPVSNQKADEYAQVIADTLGVKVYDPNENDDDW